MSDLEYRVFPQPATLRQSEDGDVFDVKGYASVFNAETRIGDFFIEKVSPGAFSKTLRNNDQIMLLSHGGLPIARRSSETLSLKEDATGLAFIATLDSGDSDSRSLRTKLDRGDVDGMSIGFRVIKSEWEEREDELDVRTITEMELFEISAVAFPAFPQTSISLRSAEQVFNEERNSVNQFRSDSLKRELRLKAALRGFVCQV